MQGLNYIPPAAYAFDFCCNLVLNIRPFIRGRHFASKFYLCGGGTTFPIPAHSLSTSLPALQSPAPPPRDCSRYCKSVYTWRAVILIFYFRLLYGVHKFAAVQDTGLDSYRVAQKRLPSSCCQQCPLLHRPLVAAWRFVLFFFGPPCIIYNIHLLHNQLYRFTDIIYTFIVEIYCIITLVILNSEIVDHTKYISFPGITIRA